MCLAGVDMNATSALYASGRDRVVALIAQLGAIAPGGGIFEDLGVPSISPGRRCSVSAPKP